MSEDHKPAILPRAPGRLYMVVLRDVVKVGSSHRVEGRVRDVVRDGFLGCRVVESVTIGAPNENFRQIEKELHRTLLTVPKFTGSYGLQKEWYRRNAELEGLLAHYLREGYSETLLPSLALFAIRYDEAPRPTVAGCPMGRWSNPVPAPAKKSAAAKEAK